jgi:tetratricopeptide (TPR) repeat protein
MQRLRRRARRVFPALAVLLVAVAFIAVGARFAHQEPGQITYYNAAMRAYVAQDVDAALLLLDESLAEYEEAHHRQWWHNALNGGPNDEVAAQAHFHKGVLLLIKAQAEQRPGLVGQAVEEWQQSLRINPGAPYNDHVAARDAQRLNEQALVVKHNLDLLFQQNPEQQEGQGNGEGQGPPKPANSMPGDQPGDKPGRGEDDGI